MSLLSTSVSADTTGIEGVPLTGSRRGGSRFSSFSSTDNSGVDAPDFSAALRAASAPSAAESALRNPQPATQQTDSPKNQKNNKKQDDDSDQPDGADASAQGTDQTAQGSAEASTDDKGEVPPKDSSKNASKDQSATNDDQKNASQDAAAQAALASAQANVQAQVPPATPAKPVAAAAGAPSKDAANAVSASPFLDPFSGIAESLHRQELGRQAQAVKPELRGAEAPQAAADAGKGQVSSGSKVEQQTQTPVLDIPTPSTSPKEVKNKAANLALANVQAESESDSVATTPGASAVSSLIPEIVAAGAEAAAFNGQNSSDGGGKNAPNQATQADITVQIPAVKTETASAGFATPAQESPAPDPQQLLDQVVLGLQGKFDAQNGKAEIQLNPPNLGPLHVSVTLQNGTLTAEFQSSSELVRGLLKDNLDKLKTVLQGQGVAVDKLAVDAPPAATAQGQGQQASFGSAAHDGRSAGQHQQDPRPNQRKPGENDTFARFLNQAGQQAPIDLVA